MTPTLTNTSYASLRMRPYGERGLLLDQLGDEARFVIARATEIQPPQSFAECVLGAENVLLLFTSSVDVSVVEAWLATVSADYVAVEQAPRCVEVPVVYDGPDLEEVAELTGLSVQEVVELHRAPLYRVRMIGFTPGFPYLDGLDSRLHLPRKASPRNRIEPGAVAIGGSHAGIYSVASPGGWHILGRTDMSLFQPDYARDAAADSEAIFSLAPGDTVRFVAH